jgi:signal peptidase I
VAVITRHRQVHLDKSLGLVHPPPSYFVVGDNEGGSTDSRVFGPIPASGIKAKLSLRIVPMGRFGHLSSDVRLVAHQG